MRKVMIAVATLYVIANSIVLVLYGQMRVEANMRQAKLAYTHALCDATESAWRQERPELVAQVTKDGRITNLACITTDWDTGKVKSAFQLASLK